MIKSIFARFLKMNFFFEIDNILLLKTKLFTLSQVFSFKYPLNYDYLKSFDIVQA